MPEEKDIPPEIRMLQEASDECLPLIHSPDRLALETKFAELSTMLRPVQIGELAHNLLDTAISRDSDKNPTRAELRKCIAFLQEKSKHH